MSEINGKSVVQCVVAVEIVNGLSDGCIMELIWVLVLFFGFIYSAQLSELEVVYQWKYLEWVWPNVELTGKNYTLGNAFTQDVDIDSQGRVFVTSPQWLEGVPISLSLVTKIYGSGGRLLVPYPNWSWYKPNSCDSILSVYRIAVISDILIQFIYYR